MISAVAVLMPGVGVFCVQVMPVKLPRLPFNGVEPRENVSGQSFSISVAVTVMVTGVFTSVETAVFAADGSSFTHVMLRVTVAALEVWTPSFTVYWNELC